MSEVTTEDLANLRSEVARLQAALREAEAEATDCDCDRNYDGYKCRRHMTHWVNPALTTTPGEPTCPTCGSTERGLLRYPCNGDNAEPPSRRPNPWHAAPTPEEDEPE